MEAERKTIWQWAKEDGIEVLDPDGFDRRDPELRARLRSRQEWEAGWPACTIRRVVAGREYLGTPAFSAPEMSPPGGWVLGR